MRIYMATFAWKAFSGYHLWRVDIRAKPRQPWAKATFHAGRTDTEHQALGMIAQALEGIDLGAVREEPTSSWPYVRKAIKKPGDTRQPFQVIHTFQVIHRPAHVRLGMP